MAQVEDFPINQGADFAAELYLADAFGNTKNLTGYSTTAKIKRNYNSDSDGTYQFGAIVAAPAADGLIVLSLTNVQTDAMKAGRYVYDVELSYQDSGGNTIIERILEGQITVSPSVTR